MKKIITLLVLSTISYSYTMEIPSWFTNRSIGNCTIHYDPNIPCKFKEKGDRIEFIVPNYYSFPGQEKAIPQVFNLKDLVGEYVYINNKLRDLNGNSTKTEIIHE